jgi:hypothetical protein
LNFSGVNDTAENDIGDFRSNDPCEYEAMCETVLTRFSGTKIGSIDEKTEG